MQELQQDSWNQLISQAYQHLTRKQDELMQQFRLGEHQRFDWDQASGSLVFSNDGAPAVIASVQFVGSVSTASDTWLWSWANATINDNVKNKILQVREFGEQHQYPALTEEQWPADEIDGWEMTSVSARILKARGAYRTRSEQGFTYMVITDICWAN